MLSLLSGHLWQMLFGHATRTAAKKIPTRIVPLRALLQGGEREAAPSNDGRQPAIASLAAAPAGSGGGTSSRALRQRSAQVRMECLL